MNAEQHIKINNLIDLGTDGKFLPGREAGLMAKLVKHKDGEQIFKRLLDRGAIEIIELPEVESTESKAAKPKEPKKDGNSKKAAGKSKTSGADKETETEEQSGSSGTEIKEPDYEGTGQYEFKPYGGGNCEIIDPDGFVIDTIRGHEKAANKVEELNKTL